MLWCWETCPGSDTLSVHLLWIPILDVSCLWKCLLSVWWRAEERMLHQLQRGRHLHEWSKVTDIRRCFLVAVDAPSIHKGCFSVHSFTGRVYLSKRGSLEIYLVEEFLGQGRKGSVAFQRWNVLLLFHLQPIPVVEGSIVSLFHPVLPYCSILFPFWQNCFELFIPNCKGQKIKACKTDGDGKVVEGKHQSYKISAATPAERDEWIEAIRWGAQKWRTELAFVQPQGQTIRQFIWLPKPEKGVERIVCSLATVVPLNFKLSRSLLENL